MARKGKFTDKVKEHTEHDEINVLHEVAEEDRLRRQGLDPDKMDSLELLLELKRRMAQIKEEKAQKKKARDDKKS